MRRTRGHNAGTNKKDTGDTTTASEERVNIMKLVTTAFGTALLAFCILATGCSRSGASITMAGSTAFQSFAEKLAEQYMQGHPDVNITVQGGGSAVGIQSALSGAAQIGMADLVELPTEASVLTSTVVARDGIAVIVHPSNAVKNMSTDQIRGVFCGTITNWKDLGGADQPITVVSREAKSGTRTSFEQIVKDIKLTPDAIVQDSNGAIRETVANNTGSIGYITHGIVNEKIKPLTVDGIESTTAQILAGNYKLVRPVFLLVQATHDTRVDEFIAYILSAEGQQTIKNNGLIPAK